SMQADGWPLWAAASDGSGASGLAIQTLVYTDFLTALPNSNQVVVVEGAGRLASMNKQLQSIEFSPTQRPTPDGALQPDLEWRNTPLSVRRTGEIVELLPDVSSDG